MADEIRDLKSTIKFELQGQKDLYILYLDDETDLLENIGSMIEDLGFKPLTTTDSAQACKWIFERRADIAFIISDLRMPVMDGFSFREAVEKIAPEIPFSILSAHVDTEIALRGVDLKICAFFSKPITLARFQDVVYREAMPRVRIIKEDRELRAGFVSESEGLFTEGEGFLLSIDENPKDVEVINRFFGIIHTLKGASSFFEPKTLHKVAHRYEDVLKKLQRFEVEYSEAVSAVLFKGFDLLKELFAEFKEGVYLERDLDVLLATIDLARAQVAIVACVPEAGATPGPALNSQKAVSRSNEEVKVSVALLDEFMQLSGEVTVIRNMLNKCVRAIERQYSGDRDVAMVAELLDELHKINGGVQNKISEIRKVTVKSVIKALPRAVRDVSKQIGKQVELEVTGDDLRVDTAIAEVLNNCLLHLVKNSMDHGLETPEQRRKCGKSEKGKVSLRFTLKDDKVVVEIEDDGQGINGEAIKSKLVKNGTHTLEQANALPAQELHSMIFASGFSTAAQVTDISGRGVGMSMVKDSVDAIDGEIQIDSSPGTGTKFRLSFPVPKSVLIASCLSVRAGGLQLGLIQDDILRVLQFDENQAKEVMRDLSGAKAMIFDGDLVPLVRLDDFMKVGRTTLQADFGGIRRIVVMNCAQDGRRIAVEVDEVLDVEDTVVKGIHAIVNPSMIYRGVTFLDDGTLGLILSTAGIMDALKLTAVASSKRSRKVSSQEDSTQKVLADLNNTALLIGLPIPGIYALRLEDIHRIEEIQADSLRRSGRASVIPYRGGILEIRNLGEIFEGVSRSDQNVSLESVFPLIVVRNGSGWMGLRVSSVLDTVMFSVVQNELADSSHAVEGHFVANEKTVTLLSLEQVLALFDNSARAEPRPEQVINAHSLAA